MPSTLHEALIELFRRDPELAPRLLREGLHLEVPPYRQVEVAPADFTQLAPTEYRADLVLVLSQEQPVFGIVLEVQLQIDPRKRRTWPVYQTTLYSRLDCQACVLVVAPDPDVAAWASQPIVTGPGSVVTPLVLTKGSIPRVTDAAQARKSPELAVLSSLQHGNDPGGIEVVLAALDAVLRVDDEHARFCYDWIVASLGEATRRALEEIMRSGTYEYQTEFAKKYVAEGRAEGRTEGRAEGRTEGRTEGRAEGRAEGEAKGKGDALLKILAVRGLPVSEAQRARILTCQDLALLDHWLELAVTAPGADNVLT